MVKSSRNSPTGLADIEFPITSETATTVTLHNASVLYSSLNHTLIVQRQLRSESANITPSYLSSSIKEEALEDSLMPNNSITKKSKTKRKGSFGKVTQKTKKANSAPTSPTDDSSSNGKRKSCNRWTKNENELLIKAIEKYGEKKWNEIAKMVATKNSDQCNQHWWRVLNPKICKKPWTEDEDNILVDKVREFGESAWKSIADSFQGRTDIQCRHRWIMLRKYEQEGKGRPVSRTNITCNSNVSIPQKLKETLETSNGESKRSTRKKRSVSDASARSVESYLSNEGDLLCNEDPFQMGMHSMDELRTFARSEKVDDYDRANTPVSLEDDLVDESVYSFDQQEILLCEGSAIVPFECKLEVPSSPGNYDCFEGMNQDELIKKEIDFEEKMFSLQGSFPDSIKHESKELSVFADWDEFVSDFNSAPSRQSYLADNSYICDIY